MDEQITGHALAARRGDDAALSAFIRATQPDVWRYTAYLVNREAADDLTQETYLRALRGLRSFRGETSARVWLLSIARRTVVDHFRRQGRRPRVASSLDEGATVASRFTDPAADPAEPVTLRCLIGALDPDKRAAFVLTQIAGLSYVEAAQACDVAVGTIRSRVARARADLLDWLREPGADAPPAQAAADASTGHPANSRLNPPTV